MTADFLKADLRPGNVYTSNGVVDFVKSLIAHYNDEFPETTPFVRGDSGFAVPGLYELCEDESVYYVIRLKSNPNLQRLADELHPSTVPSDVTETECYYEETEYQANSWSKPRKVIIQTVRPAGELFFTHSLCNEFDRRLYSRRYCPVLSKKMDNGKLYQGSERWLLSGQNEQPFLSVE